MILELALLEALSPARQGKLHPLHLTKILLLQAKIDIIKEGLHRAHLLFNFHFWLHQFQNFDTDLSRRKSGSSKCSWGRSYGIYNLHTKFIWKGNTAEVIFVGYNFQAMFLAFRLLDVFDLASENLWALEAPVHSLMIVPSLRDIPFTPMQLWITWKMG